uniref:Uncharacterized protein n=1 Tax=Sipha flava TaxID=143950 RepID=A0A2S2R226_9HEMI
MSLIVTIEWCSIRRALKPFKRQMQRIKIFRTIHSLLNFGEAFVNLIFLSFSIIFKYRLIYFIPYIAPPALYPATIRVTITPFRQTLTSRVHRIEVGTAAGTGDKLSDFTSIFCWDCRFSNYITINLLDTITSKLS